MGKWRFRHLGVARQKQQGAAREHGGVQKDGAGAQEGLVDEFHPRETLRCAPAAERRPWQDDWHEDREIREQEVRCRI